MELEKGVCFSCDNKTLISNSCTERIQQIFVYLYTETVLNVNKLQGIIPALKLCPVCHHKLIILEQIYKHIEANRNIQDEDENCALCKKGDLIFKLSKNYFKDISDDFPFFSDKHKYEICSQCCFYLDCRYYLKKRLFSQYPQLRIVPKLKLKFGSEITSHSTPLVTQKRERLRQHKRSSSEVILVESDTEMPPQETRKGLDLSSIKSFEVLRKNKLISKSKKICRDSKLLNQILYVKLSTTYSASDIKNLSSRKSIEAQNDLTMLPKTLSKKPRMRREKNKKVDKMIDSENISVEKNESNLNNSVSIVDIETSESVPISEEDSLETSEDGVNMKKPTYFKIKLKKQTTRTNKSAIKEHVEKNHIITDNFKKSLVVNVERRAMLCGTSNLHSEKHSDNEEDMSIEVAESEERSQTVMNSSRMDIDSTDNSKLDEHRSPENAEEKDSETTSEKEQSKYNHETSSEESEKKMISKESEELDNEGETEKSHENDETESNGNTDSIRQSDESKPEIDEHEEKNNSDEEQPSKDDEENENVHISDEMKEEEKKNNIPDQEGSSQKEINEEENSSEKSGDSSEEAVSKTKANIDQENSVEAAETNDKELPGTQEETDEKTDEDEASGTKEKDNVDESGDEKETGDKEKTDDHEEIIEKGKCVDKEGSRDEIEEKEEIGLGEEDRNNIDMMLSGLAAETSDLTKEVAVEAENGATDKSTDVSNADQDNDIVTGCKRKRSDSPDVSSPEKKKKKVTFSEEVLESSE